MNAALQIDMAYLLKKVRGLADVKARRRTWNEVGQRLELEVMPVQRAYHLVPPPVARGKWGAPSLWQEAKELVFAVMASGEPEFEAIRGRIRRGSSPTTQLLLSTLDVWLAGRLGVSVTITSQMAAVMLYAVSESPAGWKILLDES